VVVNVSANAVDALLAQGNSMAVEGEDGVFICGEEPPPPPPEEDCEIRIFDMSGVEQFQIRTWDRGWLEATFPTADPSSLNGTFTLWDDDSSISLYYEGPRDEVDAVWALQLYDACYQSGLTLEDLTCYTGEGSFDLVTPTTLTVDFEVLDAEGTSWNCSDVLQVVYEYSP
jgi:hypothetical protein